MIRGIGPAYGKKLVLAAAFWPNAWRFVGLACASKTSQHFLPRRLWFQLHPGNDCPPRGVAFKTLSKLRSALPEYSGTGSQERRRDGRQRRQL